MMHKYLNVHVERKIYVLLEILTKGEGVNQPKNAFFLIPAFICRAVSIQI